MVHTIRKLAREVHRRSVWQVLGVYAVGSWFAVQGVDSLATRAGLPLWTADMAAVLLLVGLPIVVATAVVQNGIPWLRIEDAEDPNDLVGRTPDEVHVLPGRGPYAGRAVFTWPNAILGGVMAAALLATSVVAYLSMWALGIGPVGSLMAQGYVAQDDRVLLAEFENRTVDTGLSLLVMETFVAGLSASTLVRVVDSGLSRAEALRAAGRDEIRIVVDGILAEEGDGFGVTAFIHLADGSQLARFHDVVDDREDLEGLVEELAVRVRERLGEPLRTIRAGG